jgi:formate dehydrogenase-N alpha subunit
MTNHWVDMVNADVVMIMGGNPAENHPIAMNWIRKTKERGAIVLQVDPRFNRTSHIADVYAKMRSGTDIAFVGGMINYALARDRVHWDYVRAYTTAAFIVREDFRFDDGLFSGYDTAARAYDKSSWGFTVDSEGRPRKDPTLRHPRCVLQLLKKHFARYDPDTVCSITGTPPEIYRKVCDHFTSTFAPDRAGTWLYAMGTAQHTHGTQNIRSYAILQLLLGNIGVAGGGINAMRGESNVQGSTDQGLAFDMLPGYLKMPVEAEQRIDDYFRRVVPVAIDAKAANWLQHTPAYVVSLLKAWWGEHATAANGFAYDYLPKLGRGFQEAGSSHIPLFEAMLAGQIKGLFCFGQNPAVGGPNSNFARTALDKLEWLVAADVFENESHGFWKRPGARPADLRTEVFLLPAAGSVEKEGSITNSARWMQWRHAATKPLGKSLPDAEILTLLAHALKEAYAKGGVRLEPIVNLAWDYGTGGTIAHAVAKEINGRFVADVTTPDGHRFRAGSQVPSFTLLRDDGTTAAGNWIYCGSYTDAGNMAARRDPVDAPNNIGLYPGWAWAWPANRRILYNRASLSPAGHPWNPRHWVIRWNAQEQRWEGDVPDGAGPPTAIRPFIMTTSGQADLFTSALADGPFPEHYEPVESPIRNPMSSIQFNPATKVWNTPGLDAIGTPDRFPIVATTYRVSEHWQTGAMSRKMSWLVGLMPDAFVEISRDLARLKGIANGNRVVVETARGRFEGYALVTDRFEPFWVQGRTIHQVGVPWHWGWVGLSRGDSANLLTPHVGDANTMIPEFKAFLCDLNRKGTT